MLSLSIFSSSQRISIALYEKEELKTFYQKKLKCVKMDSIFLLLEKIFKKKKINIHQIFFSIGPGSFTSIRSIKAIAEGISNVFGSKIINISEFDIYLASLERKHENVLVFYESPNKKYFYQHFKFQNNKYESSSNLCVGDLVDVSNYISIKKKKIKNFNLISNADIGLKISDNVNIESVKVCIPCARKLANAVFTGYGKPNQKIIYHHTYYAR